MRFIDLPVIVLAGAVTVIAQQNTNWTTFSGDYTGQRHSPLTQLTPKNVAGLVPQWVFQTDIPGLPGRGIENSPIVFDGVVYVTGNNNQAWAIDARTGRPIWKYRRALPPNFSASVCCGPVNRGFALQGDRLYMGTLDAHLVVARPQDGRGRSGTSRSATRRRRNADHGGAARRERQGHHRRGRRRLREPRLHRRLRRADGRACVAVLHDSWPWRAGQRVVAERRSGARGAAGPPG